MKYWILVGCLFFVGCGGSGPTNVVGDADQQALDDYEAALAEADAMAAGDPDFER
ncbi:hypothetical protein [Novipirellula artificiosorum]|uniref:Secreted protein n=1 Tax=Novipirellula artificiosorum TaxID=2528016 RepID=A0A5C6E168_9BACT|nr:hypothetical protein [Novipirellula artificiosorum]TWU40929.1 hypothetical protein Poly41_17640 [Novipirellula artificiosorum]